MAEKMKRPAAIFWLIMAMISPWAFMFSLVLSMCSHNGWFLWGTFISIFLAISLAGICGVCALPQEQRRSVLARIAFWWNIVTIAIPPLLVGLVLYWHLSHPAQDTSYCVFFVAYLITLVLTLAQSVVFRQPWLLVTFVAQCIFFGVVYYWLTETSDLKNHPVVSSLYHFINYVIKWYGTL